MFAFGGKGTLRCDARWPLGKTEIQRGKIPVSVGRTRTEKVKSIPEKPPLQVIPEKPPLLSISGEGGAAHS
jgi:hypothetical protein